MSWLNYGADAATMLTGASAVTATYVWVRGQVTARRERLAAQRLRDWTGWIDVGGINSWRVRLAEEPSEPSAYVVIEVVDDEGRPRESDAHNMRQKIMADGMLARVPSPEEFDFLVRLRQERREGPSTRIGP